MFPYDYSCKIVLVGECSVGKTALTQRLIYDMYQKKLDPTIGVDYSTKMFKMNDSKLVKVTNVGYSRTGKFYKFNKNLL